MAEPGIRILETLVLKGPNYWSYRPSVCMRIDLGPFRDRNSKDLAGFHDRLIGVPVSFGRTRETKTPGVYNLVYAWS